jgi:uncharacterized protein (TIGR02118 family)
MIKRLVAFSLPEGADPEEFWRYWQEEHVPGIMRLPGLKKYVINRLSQAVAGEPKFWGVAESWWESEAAMRRAFASPQGKACQDDFMARITGFFAAIMEEKVNL